MNKIYEPTILEMSEVIPFLREALLVQGRDREFSLASGDYNNRLVLNGNIIAVRWPQRVSGDLSESRRLTLNQDTPHPRTKENDGHSEWYGTLSEEALTKAMYKGERDFELLKLPLNGGLEITIRRGR